MDHTRTDRPQTLLLAIAFAGLGAGLVLQVGGWPDIAQIVWFAGVLPVLVALVLEILCSPARGEVWLDIVAALSMMVVLTFGETLAAAVFALMYSGGAFLKGFAEGRGRCEMLASLRRQGITRILLATDDRAEVAARVTEGLGLAGIHAGKTPDQTVLLALSEQKKAAQQ